MSATQAQITAVYDLENIIPAAVASVIVSATGFVVATYATQNQFQKQRPRVEVMFQTEAEIVPRFGIQTGGVMAFLNGAYKGRLTLSTITDSEDSQKATHSNYVTQLRWLCPQLPAYCNGTLLTNHKLQFVRETGTTFHLKPEEGDWLSEITYEVDLSIQASALQTLVNS